MYFVGNVCNRAFVYLKMGAMRLMHSSYVILALEYFMIIVHIWVRHQVPPGQYGMTPRGAGDVRPRRDSVADFIGRPCRESGNARPRLGPRKGRGSTRLGAENTALRHGPDLPEQGPLNAHRWQSVQ